MTTLFDPVTLGDCQFKNRIFMAPLTRRRSGSGARQARWSQTNWPSALMPVC